MFQETLIWYWYLHIWERGLHVLYLWKLWWKYLCIVIVLVLTKYDASKYALCTFFSFYNEIYTGILRTLEILYMCARKCLLLRPNKITKKSFLLNDPHLRNIGINRLHLCSSICVHYVVSKCHNIEKPFFLPSPLKYMMM